MKKQILFFTTILFCSKAFANDYESFNFDECLIKKNIFEDEVLSYKFVSFKDHVAVKFNLRDLYHAIDKSSYASFLELEKDKVIDSKVSFHCGAYGSSIILKYEKENRDSFCAWLGVKDKSFFVKSFGNYVAEDSKDFCHGVKLNELILTMTSEFEEDALERLKTALNDSFGEGNYSLIKISNKTYKLISKEENEKAREKLVKNASIGPLIKIDYNWFSHPVGEFKE